MDAFVVTESRAYRKNLTASGLIYLGLEEHPIHVINMSLTGMLLELSKDATLNTFNDIFHALQVSSLVDFYLPDLHMAGDAHVVRAYPGGQGIAIAVEFRNLSYDTEDQPYNRRVYRKPITTYGLLTINDSEFEFATENVSVDGLMARLSGEIDIEVGSFVGFAFEVLELQGQAQVVWVEKDEVSTLLGLKYQHLERNAIKGIPNFARDQA